jgi:hypothetical protein
VASSATAACKYVSRMSWRGVHTHVADLIPREEPRAQDFPYTRRKSWPTLPTTTKVIAG